MTGWLGLSGLAEYLSVSTETVQKLVAEGRLPRPIYLTPRLPRWRLADIDATLTKGVEKDWQAIIEERLNAKEAARQDGKTDARRRNRKRISI